MEIIMSIHENELKIVELFRKNVLGRKPDTSGSNVKHAGKAGHWLEKQMGVAANRNTAPDLLGFEMKNGTRSKTTFGDWTANDYIFKNPQFNSPRDRSKQFNRDDFLRAFGKPNALKNNRLSWSGEPVPKIDQVNGYGCIMRVDNQNNILIIYDYQLDQRPEKDSLVPLEMQVAPIVLAKWNADSLRKKVEDKFNQNGWFKCELDENGVYTEIVFGEPLSFENWINFVKQGIIFFDSGMYATNNRPYSMWRANNALWSSLIIRRY